MADVERNYWWLNANPAIWDYSEFAPGEENDYTQFNENGSPRQIQKFFPQVRPGDLVLGYSTTPKKQLSCLCKITRPLKNGVFHYAKVLDFPNPVPSSDWTADPLLSHFHFQGSLFKLSQDQWDGFIRLVKERNPGMTIPQFGKTLSKREQMLRALFTEMLLPKYHDWIGEWHKTYQSFCEQVSQATKIDDNLFDDLLWKHYNGVSVLGQSILSKRLFATLKSSPDFRHVLELFKMTPNKAHFSELVELSDAIARKAGHRSFHLRMNRIAVTFNTELSSVPNTDAFSKILRWLSAYGLLTFRFSGDWFDDNLRFTQTLTTTVADIPGYDIWNRNMFLWWLYETYVDPHRPPPKTVLEASPMPQSSSQSEHKNEPEATMIHPLNTILYGPPGTGKTHDVVNDVLEIIDGVPMPKEQTPEEYAVAKMRFDELKAQGRVAFATFHQSYGYEDFIEGIRPVLNGESGAVAYKLHDGVFKEFCNRAHAKTAVEPSGEVKSGDEENLLDALHHANDVVWKVSLGGSLRKGRSGLERNKRIHEECFKDGNIRIGWDQYGPRLNESTDYFMGGQSVLNAFISKAAVGDIVISLCTSSTIDGIGIITGDYEWTGKSGAREKAQYDYFNRIRPVRWIVRNTQLFIRDLNAKKDLSSATFYRTGISKASILALAEKALAGSTAPDQKAESVTGPETATKQPYVFVIDEINRGNISKIFGELITLVEVGKRLGAEEETKVVLPYSKKEFGVPPNVYILGTMNTADRSIALLDTALRRRFDFVEMMPRPELLPKLGPNGIDLQAMLKAMNERIEFLLDREHAIGHAYFMGDFAANPTLKGLADIFRHRIVPLLQEYFFEDYAKIRLVLGDASFKRKAKDCQFVMEEKGKAKELFPGVPDDFGGPVNGEQVLYRINKAAFEKAEAYLGIYQPLEGVGGSAEAAEDGE